MAFVATVASGVVGVEAVRYVRRRDGAQGLAAEPAGSRVRSRAAPAPGHAEGRVVAFVQRWYETLRRSRGRDLGTFYAERASFSGNVRDRGQVVSSWTEQLDDATAFMLVDFQRLEAASESVALASVPAACRDGPGMRGDVVHVRVFASEDRSAGNRWVPCRHLEGPYHLRLRDTANGYAICHEYWGLHDAICTSCPASPACGGR